MRWSLDSAWLQSMASAIRADVSSPRGQSSAIAARARDGSWTLARRSSDSSSWIPSLGDQSR